MTHTPGSWETSAGPSENGESVDWCVCAEGGGDIIAEISRPYGESDQTLEANCRLIAAAPDLLDALQAALHEVEAFERRTGVPQFVTWINQARAAITKATK